MPLTNFGAVLNFAETLERQDMDAFLAFSDNPKCSEYKALFEQFAKENQKNIKTLLRTRRENVTEMILEPIKDFNRQAYCEKCGDCESMDADEALSAAGNLSRKAVDFYLTAAEKLKALPEVSRTLKRIAKNRQAQMNRLAEM